MCSLLRSRSEVLECCKAHFLGYMSGGVARGSDTEPISKEDMLELPPNYFELIQSRWICCQWNFTKITLILKG